MEWNEKRGVRGAFAEEKCWNGGVGCVEKELGEELGWIDLRR
jgi:hypothetical protein